MRNGVCLKPSDVLILVCVVCLVIIFEGFYRVDVVQAWQR